MTRAEALSRQEALRAVLTAAGWRRFTSNGNEFWQLPDLAEPPSMTFESALKQSITARAHPYHKSVMKTLARAREEYNRLNPPSTGWARMENEPEIDTRG